MASSSESSANSVTVKAGDKDVRVFTQLFIDGKWVPSQSGKTFKTLNPATEEPIAEVAEGGKADIDLAVAAARKALDGAWGNSTPFERASVLYKLADRIEANIPEIAALESLDNGKPFGISSTVDLPLVVQTLRHYGGWADKVHGKTLPTNNDEFLYTRREPVGVVGQIIPWNFPLLMVAWKIGPALACGNTIVMKPAEQTPLSVLHVAHYLSDLVPPGVFNVVNGFGPTAGAALSSHMDVDKIAFTGSSEVGRLVMTAAAQSNLKKVSLELGGKSPAIILADADLDLAAKFAFANGVLFNSGQVCCSSSRIYVAESVHDAFIEKCKQIAASGWKVGDQFAPDSMQGPQVDQDGFNKILSYVEKGQAEGAKLECGGKRLGDKGYFIEPTLFSGATDTMSIAREEIFGPVATVLKFPDDDIPQAIRRGNDTAYGLAAGVFTKDLQNAHRIAHALKAGTVWVNCYHEFSCHAPFGGYRESGIGRECGKAALELYTESKTVRVKLNN